MFNTHGIVIPLPAIAIGKHIAFKSQQKYCFRNIVGRANTIEREVKERRKDIYTKAKEIKSDSFTRINKERPNIAVAMLDK